jgi:hypothetical protein
VHDFIARLLDQFDPLEEDERALAHVGQQDRQRL